MMSGAGGSIINMASVISSIGAAPDRFAYATSKAAVIGLTKSIALDYASQSIRCNAICPSAVETPSMAARISAMDNPVKARAAFESRQPIGRMATTTEIAEMAVYLAGDVSGCVTGSTIIMDGGAKL
jgi:2-keto-3-deoxy-L-fuconate dehydrogenase